MKQFFNLVSKYKHRLPTIALVVGFFVDIVTFRTLNLTYSQIILATHLSVVAFSILVLALPTREKVNSFFMRVRTWLPILAQYSTGNLLSAFLVLYSASGSLSQSWLFFVILLVAVSGNETLKLEKYRFPFHTTLFFFNLLLFSAFSVPIALGSISTIVFLFALAVSVLVFQLFLLALWFTSKNVFLHSVKNIYRGAFIVFLLLTALYFTNLIPPIPLALKEVAFYHSVQRVGNVYIVEGEEKNWLARFFDFPGDKLRLTEGEDAYIFTAIFAPARIDAHIVHHWEYFDEHTKTWITKNTLPFPILGGRQEGYRAFSFIENPPAGTWRVSIETSRGQTIGRAYLSVKRVLRPVVTKTFQQ